MNVEYGTHSDDVGSVLIEDIRSRIYTIRRVQVMLDKDLANLYKVELKRLNEQVKRNRKRFPQEFMFQLSKEENEFIRSQNATLEYSETLRSQNATSRWGGRRTLPYVFTEQGVAMLSSVLRSDEAIEMSVRIIQAFVSMRRFILSNAHVFQRLDVLERKQTRTDRKLEMVLSAIESKSLQPAQGIFFDGQIFDAYRFVSDLFRSAANSIVIIDNYMDDTVLAHLAKRSEGVEVRILTKKINETLKLDVEKFNEQYPPVKIVQFNDSHDRFIIIDRSEVYHFGASLKDLGKKWFAFSRMEIGTLDMLSKLENII